jgi:hypothetical protein
LPQVFETVNDALFSAIVLWTDKLFAEDSQRGLGNFLKFVEHHRPIFSRDAFQHRRNLPNDDLRLERVRNVEFETVQRDQDVISSFEPLKSIRLSLRQVPRSS